MLKWGSVFCELCRNFSQYQVSFALYCASVMFHAVGKVVQNEVVPISRIDGDSNDA